MDTKSLLIGIISFMAGGLLVSVVATTIEKPEEPEMRGMSMSQMARGLENKSGREFDERFLAAMIEHHEGAIDMAEMAESRAEHAEIKELSRNIILAQEQEIQDMKSWQKSWGYEQSGMGVH